MSSESSSCCRIAALAPSIGNAHYERPVLLRHSPRTDFVCYLCVRWWRGRLRRRGR